MANEMIFTANCDLSHYNYYTNESKKEKIKNTNMFSKEYNEITEHYSKLLLDYRKQTNYQIYDCIMNYNIIDENTYLSLQNNWFNGFLEHGSGIYSYFLHIQYL